MPKTIGYLRVSTAEQDLDKNKIDMLRLAHAKERGQVAFVEEKASGKIHLDAYRPEIEALLNNGSSQRFIAQRYQTTESNLSRWLKRHGLSRTQRAAARRVGI